MPKVMPISMTPGYVSTEMEADLVLYFKTSTLIKFSKVPETISLQSDVLVFEAERINKFILKF